ncbi:hypothetical protein OG205_09755 [Lentzea sp. NBC_00516]|uniref:Uncharacterized protein n=1 Tax=Lentzea sokolovensis TaxID=3095429 RepID=A0ABU4URL1_9PSEU|nr:MULTISPECIES: hypothetical protein [unclassified Lentzea]MDX8141436.1 hypothetical protein [Lentzea sp. BCCO 10_0061]WUD27259.1 hypothetical protein OG205_09755 [Lentzea sp. NBC_00516]
MLSHVAREHPCDLCDGTGLMTWQQPLPGPDGALALTEMNHPCVNGCSGWFKLPAAERGNVVTAGTAERTTGNNVAQANLEHRTEWFRPLPPPDDHSAISPS